jgi:voltage-gated potassium channel
MTVNILLASLILLNVTAVVLETVESLAKRWQRELDLFDGVSIIIFTIEYALRLWSCTADARYTRPIRGRVAFALKPMAIIDLLAIAPYYLSAFFALDLRVLRALRLYRMVRVFKLGRYSESLRILGCVLVAKRGELASTLFALILLLVVTSSLMYFAEHETQPQQFSSIPAAMWWGVATLTTVGYGDLCPQTIPGKLLGSIVAILGIGLFALPAGILGSGFVAHLQQRRKAPLRCPHCGREISSEG